MRGGQAEDVDQAMRQHGGLFGREAELARVDEALRQAQAGNNTLLVVRGAAGQGKSALLDGAVARAGDRFTVLRTTGVEAEQTLAFSGLFDICRPLFGDLSALPDHHHQTLAAAFGLSEPVPVDRFTCGAATIGLLSIAAARQPLLVVVDDWQWVDEASAQALAFAARRLVDAPVTVLLGVRDDEPVHVDFGHGFDLDVRALDQGAAEQLVRAAADGAIADRVVGHIVAAGHGNPLALTQLVASFTPDQLSGRTLLPWSLPDLGGPQAMFAARLGELPDDARAALVVVAASVSGSVDEISRALQPAGLGLAAIEPAEKVGLVEVDGDRIRFTHPLARSATYTSAPPPERRTAHAALADAVDPGEHQEHRLLHLATATTGPDEAVAAALEDAGCHLRVRGAFGSAARLLERAAQLSPVRSDRHRRLATAADAAFLGGYLAQALELAREPADHATDAAVRALAVHVEGRCDLATGRRRGAVGRLVAEAERAAGSDPERAARMCIDGTIHLVRATAGERAVEVGRRAVELSTGLGEPLEAMAATALGAALILDGSVDEGRALLDRYEELLENTAVLIESRVLMATVPLALIWVEALDEGAQLLQRLIDEATEHAMVGALPLALVNLATIRWALGDWEAVHRLLAEAIPLAQQTGQDILVAPAHATAALTAGAQGRAEECRRHADRALALVGDAAAIGVRRNVRAALANLALGTGRAEDAIAALEPELHQPAPANPAPSLWEADLADAYALSGRRHEAEALLVDFEDRVMRTGNDRSRAALLRSLGLLAPPDRIDGLFGEAAALLSNPPIVYPLARVLFYWGARLLEVDRAEHAAVKLREAVALFDQIGAGSWSRQARAALDRCDGGGQPGTAGGGFVVSLLGNFSVESGGRDLTPRGQPADVVKILAVRGGSAHDELLIEELWPEVDPDVGRTRLRNVLARLRKTAPGLVVREGELVSLTSSTDVDAADFERAAEDALARAGAADDGAAGAVSAALARYVADALPDRPYQPWAVAARERLRARYLQLLDAAAQLAFDAGDIAGVVDAVDRAIEIERFDEERYVMAADLLRRLGRPARALPYLDRARAAAAELGVMPSVAITSLEDEIRTGGTGVVDSGATH